MKKHPATRRSTRQALWASIAMLALAACSAERHVTGTAANGGSSSAVAGMSAPPSESHPSIDTKQRMVAQGMAAPSLQSSAMAAQPANTERYQDVDPNPVKIAAAEPVSTFSIDVDTAAYINVRRFLHEGTLPPRDAVRIEEMVNYFDYAYDPPKERTAPFATSVAIMPTPWNPGTNLLHIGIKGYDIARTERPRANIVFLIDVSGSMQSADKLPLVKQTVSDFVRHLDARDRVAIVV